MELCGDCRGNKPQRGLFNKHYYTISAFACQEGHYVKRYKRRPPVIRWSKRRGSMKTIAVCAALTAFAFWLLPASNVKNEMKNIEPMVLFVETAEDIAPSEEAFPQTTQAPDGETEMIRLLTENGVLTLPMEEYLTEVLLSEMPPDFSPEARKAQAVAARTFTHKKMREQKHDGADVCADFSCCQAWTSREALEAKYGERFGCVWEDARTAVSDTAGEVVTFEGQLIDAVYFSCSGGATEAAAAVWGSDVPYLQSVESPGEQAAPRYYSAVSVSPEEFSRLLREQAPEIDLSGEPETWLGGQTRSDGGGVERLCIGGVLFSGVALRRLFGLNSAKFDLTFADGAFRFDVRGFGHRVGLSQYGAENMAQLGFSYRTILEYYYQGAKVEKA